MGVLVVGLNNIDADGDSQGTNTYKLSYKSYANGPPSVVTTGNVTDAVVGFTGMDVGTPYLTDPLSTCRSVRSVCVKRIGNFPLARWEWKTDYEFSSKNDNSPQESQNGPTKEKDPTKRPVIIACYPVKSEKHAEFSIDGLAVENSAGDPIVRTKKTAMIAFKWTKYLRQWDWTNNVLASGPMLINNGVTSNPPGFLYSRNAFLWRPAGPYGDLLGDFAIQAGKALINDIRADIVFESGEQFVKVEIEVYHDAMNFLDVFLDQGFFYNIAAASRVANNHWTASPDQMTSLMTSADSPATSAAAAYAALVAPTVVSPTASRQRFREAGVSATTPQLLDGAGNPLPLTTPRTQPQYRSYQYYQYRDWSKAPMGGQGGFFDNFASGA